MADETQEVTRAATGNMFMQPDSSSENEFLRVSQPNEQPSDEAAVWKDKYARLFADLENTKKRLILSRRSQP